jgi:uroporphyrinogen-III synthase
MSPRILVTRPAGQDRDLDRLLRERGLSPICVPTVAIDADSVAPALDAALDALHGVDWLVVTSRNGAEAVARHLGRRESTLPSATRLAAVGPATADALSRAGLRVDHVPDEYLTVAIAEGLGDVAGRRVLLARADTATPDLREALIARGARVEEVVAYRTVVGPAGSRDALHAALQRDLDGIAFTSSSTVRGLLRLAPALDRRRARAVPAFCIGPVTAATAQTYGFRVEAVATPHTADGLANEIARRFGMDNR